MLYANNSDNQKIENSLNLSLDATDEEKEKSANLDVGYDSEAKKWEVIVKYSGKDLEGISGEVEVTYLLNEYAILRISEEDLQRLALLPQVEYIEKPKRLYFQRGTGKLVSCINRVSEQPKSLSGAGVLVGILDSGIDYRSSEFQKTDGTTRIINIWDQTLVGKPPSGYYRGVEFTAKEINDGIQGDLQDNIVDTKDASGHGTEVASVAVGNLGVAYGADIMAVKLGNPQEGGFPKTTELMLGLDYLVKKARQYNQPMVVNISFGNTYGSHDGSSLLERFIDDISNYGKVSICVGMGNEGNAAGHAEGVVKLKEIRNVELVVDRRQRSFDVQLWKAYEDDMEISLITPWGEKVGSIVSTLGVQRYSVGETEILLYYGEPSPYSVLQEIYFEFIAMNQYVDSGIWKVELKGTKIVTGEYNLWLPSAIVLNEGTRFNEASPSGTVTIPATASRVVSVGAYNGKTLTYADFSGRGMSENIRLVKPDLVAPGVGIQVVTSGGGSRSVSGTSYATPFVSGSVALLMEWGIVQGNDSYLYGEKMKGYLRKGAVEILGYERYPNSEIGYGRLCLLESFPE